MRGIASRAPQHSPQVVLQLNRFCTAEGVVTKSRVPIALPSTLRLPVLVEGSTTSVRYHLSAVVLHLGDTPQRGHYRVLLVEPTGGAWLTDDGIPTKRPSSLMLYPGEFLSSVSPPNSTFVDFARFQAWCS